MVEFLIGIAAGVGAYRYIFDTKTQTQTQVVGDGSNGTQAKAIISGIEDLSSVFNISGNIIDCSSKIVVDGKVLRNDTNNCKIVVNIDGDCEKLTTSLGDVNITGGVGDGGVTTSLGNVTVGDGVDGNIQTTLGNASVTGIVTGSVKTTLGDVRINK